MRGDWFCPCLLLVGGGIWLSVSAYFAASHWINLGRQRAAWKGQECQVRKLDIAFCHYTNRDGSTRNGCRASFIFPASTGSTGAPDITLLHQPDTNKGCVFDNCADARRWAESRISENKTECWRSRSGPAKVLIFDPAGSSRRDSIVFTVCAALAGILVFSTLWIMVGLIIKSMRAEKI